MAQVLDQHVEADAHDRVAALGRHLDAVQDLRVRAADRERRERHGEPAHDPVFPAPIASVSSPTC
jgi:hypothetical protein